MLSLAGVALAVVLGTIVFQSFIVAPTVFGQLDEVAARRFLRALFPKFFRVNGIAGAIAAGALALGGTAAGWTAFYAWTVSGAGSIVAAMLLSLRLVAPINAARDAGDAGASRFARLHRATVLLTILSLLAATAILLAIGATSRGY